MPADNSDADLFASRTVPEHLVRGMIGFGAFILAGALAVLVGAWWTVPLALGLVAVALIAFRGCPLCWSYGLFATLRNRGR